MATARRTDSAIADMRGAAALPRRSGEMVFHDPWERRAFALAVAMCERGHYRWDEFRERLVAAIASTGEAPGDSGPATPGYYEHWLASLEALLRDKDLVNPPEADG